MNLGELSTTISLNDTDSVYYSFRRISQGVILMSRIECNDSEQQSIESRKFTHAEQVHSYFEMEPSINRQAKNALIELAVSQLNASMLMQEADTAMHGEAEPDELKQFARSYGRADRKGFLQ